MPASKVIKWINNNDFQQSANMLQPSNSFHSLATTEMMAYICKEGKIGHRKCLSGDCSVGIKPPEEKLDFVDNISCSQLSIGSSIPSHYLCDKTKSSPLTETVCSHNSQCSDKESVLSEDCNLPKTCANRKPKDLFFASEERTNLSLVTPKVTNPLFVDTCPLDPLTPLQSLIEPDLLSDILHTLPHADNDTLSQLSDKDSIPSHYLHDANCSDKERSLFSPDCDGSAHSHEADTDDNNLQRNGEIFLKQDITCDTMTSGDSYHAKNVKPTKLSIPKKSVSTSLFTPQVTNPIFASNSTANPSSTGSNSFTSGSPLLQDAFNFVLLSQLDEDTNDDVFSLAGSNSGMPSHYLCEENRRNDQSEMSLNEFSHCSTNDIDDNGCEREENISLKDINLFVNGESEISLPRKSISLPVIIPKPINPNFAGITPACASTSLFQSSNQSSSPSAELSNLCCKQTNCDVSLSQLSIDSTIPSQGDLSNARSLSHYFDDGRLQNVHNVIDINNSLQANESFQDALSDLCLEETSDMNSVNPIFTVNHEFSTTNLVATAALGEEYRSAIEDLDIDTISQFSNSDTNSEFNGCADSEFDDFNFGYT